MSENYPLTGNEEKKILGFYKNLFQYPNVYLFPLVNGRSMEPELALGDDPLPPFFPDSPIDWINYYQKVLLPSNSEEQGAIGAFFEHFDLDMLCPIRMNGTCFGFLGINARGKPLNHLEQQIAGLIVRYLGTLWTNRRLVEDIRTNASKTETLLMEISTLLEVNQAIESGGEIQSVLETIMEKCMDVLKVEAVSLLLLTENKKELEFRVALGPRGKEVQRYRVKVGQGIAGTVAKTGKPLLIPDAYSDKRFDRSFDLKSGFRTRSILCMPLTYRGTRLGVVQALNRFDGKPFGDEDLRSFNLFTRQAALAIVNARLLYQAMRKKELENQLTVASEIQRLIVPKQLPKFDDLDVSGYYRPSQQIGGDFYSVIRLNDNQTVFCVADVAGKSVPGALLVSTLHSTLNAYLEFSNDLEEIVNRLNTRIMKMSTSDRFITLFLALYDRKEEALSYISAGHNPQFLMHRPFEIRRLTSTGICIGITPFAYKAKTVSLNEDDILVMYTDGFVEGRNNDGDAFGEKRLEKILYENADRPAGYIIDQIVSTFNDFCRTPSDDLTLLVVKKIKSQ